MICAIRCGNIVTFVCLFLDVTKVVSCLNAYKYYAFLLITTTHSPPSSPLLWKMICYSLINQHKKRQSCPDVLFIKRYSEYAPDCWLGTVYTHFEVQVMLFVGDPTVTMKFRTTVITQLFLYFYLCLCVK